MMLLSGEIPTIAKAIIILVVWRKSQLCNSTRRRRSVRTRNVTVTVTVRVTPVQVHGITDASYGIRVMMPPLLSPGPGGNLTASDSPARPGGLRLARAGQAMTVRVRGPRAARACHSARGPGPGGQAHDHVPSHPEARRLVLSESMCGHRSGPGAGRRQAGPPRLVTLAGRGGQRDRPWPCQCRDSERTVQLGKVDSDRTVVRPRAGGCGSAVRLLVIIHSGFKLSGRRLRSVPGTPSARPVGNVALRPAGPDF